MSDPNAECPRCGYDLSGEVARWVETCPLQGTCPECGLSFAWRSLLNPRHRVLERFFEHAHPAHLPRAFFETLRRLLVPWRFWKWVRLENEIRRRRLFIFVLLCLGLAYALGLLCNAGHWVLETNSLAWASTTPDLAYIWPYGFRATNDWMFRSAFASGWFGPSSGYASPQPMVLLVGLWTVLTPFAFLLLPLSLRRARVRREHVGRAGRYALAAAGFLATLPLVYAVGGRWLGNWSYVLGKWVHDGDLNHSWWLWLLVAGAWNVVWARGFAAHYCRLPTGWLVASCMTVLSLLVTLVVMLFTGPLREVIYAVG